VGSGIEIRRLSASRRWLAKERMLGNYGGAADIGAFGPDT
jgi:hypothetical protein